MYLGSGFRIAPNQQQIIKLILPLWFANMTWFANMKCYIFDFVVFLLPCLESSVIFLLISLLVLEFFHLVTLFRVVFLSVAYLTVTNLAWIEISVHF